MAAWAKEASLPLAAVSCRITRHGWDPERALTTPLRDYSNHYNKFYYTVYDGRTDEFICAGDAASVAKALGYCDASGLYQAVSRTRRGKSHKYSFDAVPWREAMEDMME
jgi:hypothetical protein